MKRDEIKELLGENATDEQITKVLNVFHEQANTLGKEVNDLKKSLEQYSDYESIKSQLDEINKAKMTEQEKLEEAKKEITQNLKDSRITKNKAKVMEVLAGKDVDEDIILQLVSEDETKSIELAQKLATKLDSVVETTKKKTQEELANLNVDPKITNSNPNASDVMNWEKFSQLSREEQSKFAEEHPSEFANL